MQRNPAPRELSSLSKDVVVIGNLKPKIMKYFNRNRTAWRKRECGFLRLDQKARQGRLTLPKINLSAQRVLERTTPVNAESKSENTTITVDINFPTIIWNRRPFDLSEDPFSHLLHPEEISLAAILRLQCETYLINKRKIFIVCAECMRMGKDFKKTNSQKACSIDVNKASLLWKAFEEAGWLKERHISHYLS